MKTIRDSSSILPNWRLLLTQHSVCNFQIHLRRKWKHKLTHPESFIFNIVEALYYACVLSVEELSVAVNHYGKTHRTILNNDPDPPRNMFEEPSHLCCSHLFPQQGLFKITNKQKKKTLTTTTTTPKKNPSPCWSNNRGSVVSLSPAPRLYVSYVSCTAKVCNRKK